MRSYYEQERQQNFWMVVGIVALCCLLCSGGIWVYCTQTAWQTYSAVIQDKIYVPETTNWHTDTDKNGKTTTYTTTNPEEYHFVVREVGAEYEHIFTISVYQSQFYTDKIGDTIQLQRLI